MFYMLAAMPVSFFECYYKLLNFKNLFHLIIILHLIIAIYILLMFLMLYV